MGVTMEFIGSDRNSVRFSMFKFMLYALAIGGFFILAGHVIGALPPHPLESQFTGNPGNTDRYLTHITTDKPIYRIGEKLYVRAVVLRANDHSPMAGPGRAFFEIKGPKGDIVASGATSITDSVAGFFWDIPAVQAGG